jgi:hypothetical protein
MAIHHLRDGENFGDSPEHFSKEFGFSGSTKPDFPMSRNRGHSEKSFDAQQHGRSRVIPEIEHQGPHHMSHAGAPMGEAYAEGGPIEEHHPDGMVVHHHPDGHSSEHHPDGTVVHHHMHGGHSVHHASGHVEHHHPDGMISHHHTDGHVTHHHPDGRVEHHDAHGGRTVHHPDGHVEHHDSSEYAHGGHMMGMHADAMQDKAMIKKAFAEHDKDLHEGAHEDLKLARGGNVPKGLRAHGMRPDPMSANPVRGPMDYGVNSGDEPPMAGSGQAIGQLREGGHVSSRHERHGEREEHEPRRHRRED